MPSTSTSAPEEAVAKRVLSSSGSCRKASELAVTVPAQMASRLLGSSASPALPVPDELSEPEELEELLRVTYCLLT